MKQVPTILWLIGTLVALSGIAGVGMGLKTADQDPTALAIGGMIFSFGILMVSAGLFLETRMPKLGAAGGRAGARTEIRKFKVGNCATCKVEAAVVRCMTHSVPLCVACMGKHDNGKTCEYLPSARKLQ